jgi:hypothetical protein
MHKWYEPHFRGDLAVTELPGGKDERARVNEAKTNYLPYVAYTLTILFHYYSHSFG